MRSWLDEVGDTDFLARLFKQKAPSLNDVEVHEIALHRDGPSLTLTFDLPDFPTDVPAAWHAAGYNTIQLTLVAIGLRSVVMSGWATDVRGDLRISSDDVHGMRIHFDCESISLGAAAEHVRVAKLSPYANGVASAELDEQPLPVAQQNFQKL